MNERQLIELLGVGRPSRSETACPDEPLAAMVDGALPPAQRHEVELHLAGCSRCLAQIRFLIRTRDLAPAPVPAGLLEAASAGGPPRPSRSWRTPTAAAAALLAALALAMLWSPAGDIPSSNPVPVRSSEDGAAGLAILQPAAGDARARSSLHFTWTEIHGALFYEARLVSAEGEPLWEARTESAAITPPPDLLLPPGRTYYIRVRALLGDGRTIESHHVPFDILEH